MYFELLTAVTLRAISGPMNLWCSRVAAAVRMLTNSDIENGETQTTTTNECYQYRNGLYPWDSILQRLGIYIAYWGAILKDPQ